MFVTAVAGVVLQTVTGHDSLAYVIEGEATHAEEGALPDPLRPYLQLVVGHIPSNLVWQLPSLPRFGKDRRDEGDGLLGYFTRLEYPAKLDQHRSDKRGFLDCFQRNRDLLFGRVAHRNEGFVISTNVAGAVLVAADLDGCVDIQEAEHVANETTGDALDLRQDEPANLGTLVAGRDDLGHLGVIAVMPDGRRDRQEVVSFRASQMVDLFVEYVDELIARHVSPDMDGARGLVHAAELIHECCCREAAIVVDIHRRTGYHDADAGEHGAAVESQAERPVHEFACCLALLRNAGLGHGKHADHQVEILPTQVGTQTAHFHFSRCIDSPKNSLLPLQTRGEFFRISD